MPLTNPDQRPETHRMRVTANLKYKRLNEICNWPDGQKIRCLSDRGRARKDDYKHV